MYVRVLVDVPTRRVDKLFDYFVPEHLRVDVRTGCRVRVPFGKRVVDGYVIDVTNESVFAGTKEIFTIADKCPIFTDFQLRLARWMASYYLCPVLDALKTVLGPGVHPVLPQRVRRWWATRPLKDLENINLTSKQLNVLKAVTSCPGVTGSELARAAGVSLSVIFTLASRGLLYSQEELLPRGPFHPETVFRAETFSLSPEQTPVVDEVLKTLKEGKHRVFLLYGITGSGKTEVYLRAISQVVKMGRQAVMMVPEVALTPQMMEIFRARFGSDVAVLHSRLSRGERYDEWSRIKNRKAGIILGARSAVFAPVDKPALFILDEEHEFSYEQEETPRYHARDVAIRIANSHQAAVVLGSATPSLESFSRALPGGPYRLLQLKKRTLERELPRVRIIDLREELKAGNKSVFSRALIQLLGEKLDKKEQAILFLNRRGMFTFVMCRECGMTVKCPHCEISLVHHKEDLLRCHYCNYTRESYTRCPVCGSSHIGYFGIGTQKVEDEVRRLFPKAVIKRMDADTTGRKGSHREILQTFREGGADVLIGTQMVAKGLDIPRVTLVGVVRADISLHMPDFRASERTFQLLTQVAGRAGRGEIGGEVLVQTYSPSHYAVVFAGRHDYQGFFSQEMNVRKKLGYPPFTRLIRMLLTGFNEDRVKTSAAALSVFLNEVLLELGAVSHIQLLGPSPAPLSRIKDRYRHHIILKSPDLSKLREVAKLGQERFYATSLSRHVSLSTLIEPQTLM